MRNNEIRQTDNKTGTDWDKIRQSMTLDEWTLPPAENLCEVRFCPLIRVVTVIYLSLIICKGSFLLLRFFRLDVPHDALRSAADAQPSLREDPQESLGEAG